MIWDVPQRKDRNGNDVGRYCEDCFLDDDPGSFLDVIGRSPKKKDLRSEPLVVEGDRHSGGWHQEPSIESLEEMPEIDTQRFKRLPGRGYFAKNGFVGPEDGVEDRYNKHLDDYPRRGQLFTTFIFWWMVHNSIAHPLIAFLPLRPFFKFHDWTSRKMYGKK